MAIKTFDEKFTHELGDIYDAEHRFLDAQQEMLAQATDSKLQSMIQAHIGETEEQINNLEQVYKLLGQKAKREKCDAAAGLVTEGQKAMKEASEVPEILDCVIAGSAARVEHYEMANYRGLVMAAELMGNKDVLKLLKDNLKQEEQNAKKIEDSTPALLQKSLKSQAAGA